PVLSPTELIGRKPTLQIVGGLCYFPHHLSQCYTQPWRFPFSVGQQSRPLHPSGREPAAVALGKRSSHRRDAVELKRRRQVGSRFLRRSGAGPRRRAPRAREVSYISSPILVSLIDPRLPD
uniref:Uncharacterized protein n=1 Tax=Triticum urartu TaxID=4572 RepID=A0A8R7PWJ3_TRIUA